MPTPPRTSKERVEYSMDHVLTAWIWVQFASCAFLTGLIWLGQRVHYPLLAVVGDKEFVAYEREHVRRITPVVAPMMLLELVAALCLVVCPLQVYWRFSRSRASGVGFGLGLYLDSPGSRTSHSGAWKRSRSDCGSGSDQLDPNRRLVAALFDRGQHAHSQRRGV